MSSGRITANTPDGAPFCGANHADCRVDVEGSGYLVSHDHENEGGARLVDGFQTHAIASWGDDTVFSAALPR
ncbi:hypothetical protein AB2L28_20695 [Kineococcus sp. TBRC 1896]|uniref:Uncharacterized protein n=1 Tax=Kineococcus mangrovi TaxID=1660183 RepID=A0ABV4I7K4_9ACTN